ncbi:hypothetical protein PYCC9005_000512 [Savitreella phatthalungensis]
MVKYTYYDLAGNGKTAWSMNLVPTRVTMNYKGVPYESHFLWMHEVDKTLRPHGQQDSKFVTVPVLKIDREDGSEPEYMRESVDIAKYIEKEFPTPKVFPDGPDSQDQLIEYLRTKVGRALFPWILRDIPDKIFSNQADKEYFYRSRKQMFGVEDLDEICGSDHADLQPKAGSKAAGFLANIREGLTPLLHKLRQSEADGNQYLLGKEKTYADFLFVGILFMCESANPGKLEVILNLDADGRLKKYYEHIRASDEFKRLT